MSRLATGLDRLLEEAPRRLAGRRYALLAHGASVTADLEPAHLALARSAAGAPALLLGPEHGFYAVEQDMVPAGDQTDPWTGAPVASLYGDSPDSLEPAPGLFDGVDLLLVDLQDVGSRYYTYAATALWAAEAALAAGREVWVLDRPNPLGGEAVEGAPVRPGFESFVGAFPVPVRHGLSVGELLRLEARRRGLPDGLTVWRLAGWDRRDGWEATGRPWVPPSPNMPTAETAWLYPGGCLVEATRVSEGRGTTRPFHRIGAPGVDPLRLVERLAARLADDPELSGRSPGRSSPESGVAAVPIYFRPWHQKHAGALCGGMELLVTDRTALRPYRLGVHVLAALSEVAPEAFGWRDQPYEFVTDRPAIDLLTGSDAFRRALESGSGVEAWLASWGPEEERFREERRPALLYPEPETPEGVA
ncbi:MAG: exo-beta-N-acetylmuramidase NamZ domain-containing protein [Thermoanaerobaculia bacterium]